MYVCTAHYIRVQQDGRPLNCLLGSVHINRGRCKYVPFANGRWSTEAYLQVSLSVCG